MADASKANQGELLLVGTQTSGGSKGIYSYRFDETTGELKQTGLAAAIADPTFLALAPGGKRLYAATETDTFAGKHGGGITGFDLEPATGHLTEINGVPTGGTGTCHVAVDHTGHCAFAANYSGGSAASFHLDSNGRLSDAVSFFQYEGHGPNADRQEKAHAHRVTVSPENKFLLINDLGLDKIHIYKLDASTAKLTPNNPPAWKSAPGAGPRALRFHPNGKLAYCVNELASTVDVLRWNGEHGT
ncbi:MAG TPA: lactonase family protein, partial [Edaphobacter sp.]|nr:lactonase family protein [Edaphobacter sp.]